MTDAQETSLNPPAALDGARRLTGIGDALGVRWRSLRSQIDSLNGQAPWGNDEPGQQFSQHYIGDGAGPAQQVVDATEKLVARLADLGPQITEGVQGSADLDTLVGEWFGQR